MEAKQQYQWLYRHRHLLRIFAAILLIVFALGVYLLVYMTGGIKFVYSHSMYVPILLSGFLFGMTGGVLFGLFAGFVLGPFMPIDVVTGEMQLTANWLYRTGFFVLIGFLSGAASQMTRSYVERLKWASEHDLVTQLPNRNALIGRLSKIDEDKPSSSLLLLVVIFLENEMELRSSFGEAVVEEVVRQIPQRVVSAVQIESPVYRINSAQVSVLLEIDEQEQDALLDRLVDAFRTPFSINGIPIHIDVRMGYAICSRDMDSPEDCLRKAEEALAVAVERVQDKVAYKPVFRSVKQDNLAIIGSLKDALGDGQLSMHYQPKVDIRSGEVHGVEALMRWSHPELGNIPPGTFIPRAEQSTLISLVTDFALEQSMRQLAQWKKCGIDIAVAINISSRNLLQPGFADLILRLLQEYELDGASIELEVTEGALMMDMAHTIHELATLSNAKIIISVDDFGTGYSSLQYLHLLPISIIKIDQCFVRDLPAEKGAVNIVEAAVTLAHKMGMKVIAEGVEHRAAYDFLQSAGCDMAQGYLLSKPLAAEEFERWYQACGGRYAHSGQA
ncbi:MAG: GGDEF domain-containing protein [Betaproteobacteria bacterium HGW-Betaproteobacteria-1]|jgi:EAL domain-containing protein (putative c-di-GMP-specific phosphodiesterase class I)/GGDEF domain-containing protein|nr:MAG: GGDEF domain-containing protein [Betaproteobacteria bacterium HGW-Betaproteobacteria-1]